MKGAHLWKRILNGGISVDLGDESSPDPRRFAVNEQLKRRLPTEIIKAPIVVDNATGELTGTIDWSSYQHLAFPFPKYWVEGTSEEKSWGAFVVHDRTVFHAFCFIAGPATPVACVGIARTILSADGSVALDSSGSPIVTGETSAEAKSIHGLSNSHNCLRTLVAFICDTAKLLGCKNVVLSARENESKQVRRAVKRHGGTPESYRYHVLVVRPAGAKHDSPGIDIGTMPRHVCRGHYAEYGPQFGKGLLFGKYAGRFFIPPCLKGDKKNGVVEKDYVVGAASIAGGQNANP